MDAVTPSIALPSDIPDMHQFMLDEFLPSLSLVAALGITREETEERYLKLTTNCVKTGASVVLRNWRGRVVGLRLCRIEERGRPHSIEGLEKLAEKLRKIYRLVDELNEDKWASIPSPINKPWLVEVVAVDKEYRGRGLSRLFAKYDYILLKEIVHAEYLGEDGKQVFVCPGGERVAQLVLKEL